MKYIAFFIIISAIGVYLGNNFYFFDSEKEGWFKRILFPLIIAVILYIGSIVLMAQIK